MSSSKDSRAIHIGRWHITDMEMWGEDYFNMEVQAYIEIGEDGLGDFQFGLVSGSIDGHVQKCGSEPRFVFTWEGRDEMHPVSGGRWLRSTGMVAFYRRRGGRGHDQDPQGGSV